MTKTNKHFSAHLSFEKDTPILHIEGQLTSNGADKVFASYKEIPSGQVNKVIINKMLEKRR